MTSKIVILSCLVFLGFVACSKAEDAKTFVLQNGVKLPIHSIGILQEQCEFFGEILPDTYEAICIEFPISALSKDFEPLNWYGQRLVEAGFEWASGAANQYWFNWPINEHCYQRLNATAMPKERIEGDDWSEMKDYVAVFEFEDKERCENR
ncbi:MAG: hypothetical protein P8H62_14850 [Henriciella sp.]|nr:hypothetical protein [Henriciella sp.]